jgi:phage shock protein E
MLQFFKNMMGGSPQQDLGELLAQGAVIIDVRSKGEFQSGHLKNAVNIPLDTLQQNLGRIKKNRPVITCCASGMRSASAQSILKANGFTEVYNGGSWTSLRKFEN